MDTDGVAVAAVQIPNRTIAGSSHIGMSLGAAYRVCRIWMVPKPWFGTVGASGVSGLCCLGSVDVVLGLALELPTVVWTPLA